MGVLVTLTSVGAGALVAFERQRIEAAIPRGTRIVVLDERGSNLTTQALATRLTSWQLGGDDVALVIGPTTPPTLAVLAWQWLQDADPAMNAQGAAAARNSG